MSGILDEFGNPYRFAHAADRSRFRGPQYARLIGDIDRLVNSTDRRTLASLSNRLWFNFGILKTIAHQRADFSVGEAWLPAYIGKGDLTTGREAAKRMESVWYPQCDIRGGVFDWWQLLYLTSVAMDRDGDCFWLMVKDDTGFPRIQIIPSHRCHSTSTDKPDPKGKFANLRMMDGVIYQKSGRPAAYRFDVSTDNSEEFAEIPAQDVIHFFDPAYAEQGRGFPLFSHALDDIKACLASTSDERIRQVIVSRVHLIINNETGGPDPDEPTTYMDGAGPTELVTQSFPGGIHYQPGDGYHKIEQLKHENPGVVWEAFQDRMIRMTIIGSEWSTTLAWKGPGQGTAERAEIVKARNAIRRRQGILWHAKRAFSWAYANLAESGVVPALADPTAWSFSTPPRLTVDDGREAKAEMEALRAGVINLDEILQARGVVVDDFHRARAENAAMREIIRIETEKKHGVTIDPREMFLLTANEPVRDAAEPVREAPEKPTTEDDED
jgi:capsid protein